MSKKVRAIVKIQLPAGEATPAPPLGPALGPHAVNIMGFVKEYNTRTANMRGTVIPAHITIFEDRSFTFVIKSPPASAMLKKSAGLEKGSDNPRQNKVGSVTMDQIREIAKTKSVDLNSSDELGAIEIIKGTARSMGITVKEG